MLNITLSPQQTAKLQALNQRLVQTHNLLTQLEPEVLEAIHRYARISMIGASTRIENAILTDVEIEWIDTVLSQDAKTTSFANQRHLIENKFSKDRERSIEEVAGCRQMLELIYTQNNDWKPMTETVLRGLHSELMRFYPKAQHFAGKYKQQANSVSEVNHATGKSRIVFKTADPGIETELAMQKLIEWYNASVGTEAWSIAVVCEFVYRFLAIHPFQDGNGRLGRGLFLLGLLQSADFSLHSVAYYLAIDRQIEKHKSEYYFVLNRCSNGVFNKDPKKYHMEYFLDFMVKMLNAALDDVNYYHEKYENHKALAPAAKSVLQCFKEHPEMRLTTRQLIELTKLPRRTVINALNRLCEKRFLQRQGQAASTHYQLIF